MPHALARHDALARRTVERHRGTVVKMTGDGLYAAFEDPLDAVGATIELQQALDDPAATEGIALRVRCGMHAGVVERRDNDYFGSPVNRAARIMGTAHGGQVAAVADRCGPRARPTARRCFAARPGLGPAARPGAIPSGSTRSCIRACGRTFRRCARWRRRRTTCRSRRRRSSGASASSPRSARRCDATRLLTLVGAGGIGKTRLSLQVAADVLDDYPDGVWFVELAPLTDARLVPQAVASVLGVKEEAGRPVDRSAGRARGRPAAPAGARQLRAPRRRPVPTLADRLLQVGPPAADPGVEPRAAARRGRGDLPGAGARGAGAAGPRSRPTPCRAYPAVRLFVDRATAVRPAFGLTDAQRGAPSPRSAGASTAFRSRSSSPRRACARCRSRTSPTA